MATWPAKTDYATGDVLSATNMNDIGNGLNDLYGESFTNNFYAGKNKIINGDFGIWQRGTSVNLTSTIPTYLADRFQTTSIHASGTASISQQTFTAGTAPVSGYEGQYFIRLTAGASGTPSAYLDLSQLIEDVRTFAGQTITLSFWAKASVSTSITPLVQQRFGSGGSSNVTTTGTNFSVTTSWARFTQTFNVPSISGKTIGSGSSLAIFLMNNYITNSQTIDFWGVQVEAGSTATPFQTATGTKQGELAACQRYYYKINIPSGYAPFGLGYANNTGSIIINISNPVTMRVKPTSLDTSATSTFYWEGASSGNTPTTIALSGNSSEFVPSIVVSKAATFTSGGVYMLYSYNTAAYLGFNAEL